MATEARSFVVCGHAATILCRPARSDGVGRVEQLVACSHGPAERCAAAVNVRSLAADLGVSKGTVARALGRLRAAGIVTAEQPRASTGAFVAGSYRIDLPACLQLIDQSTSIADQPRPRRPVNRASDVAQLSLIDLDAPTP